MFCSNCGKELDGNEKFCKYCGNSVSYSEEDDNHNQMNDGSNCEDMVPDNGKSKFNVVIKVLFGLLAVLLVWWNANNIEKCEGIIDLIKGNCIMLCLGFWIIYALEEYSTSARNAMVFADAKYYGKYVHVNNYDELMAALNKTGCSSIKTVYYNELGTVSVQGKYDVYTLIITEDNAIEIETKKRRMKRKNVTEACNIMVTLAKYLNPKAPINAHEIVKRNNRYRKALVIYASIACGLLALCFALAAIPTSSEYIDYVKKAEFQDTGICYEDAMEKFFDETEWSYFESTDDEKVIQLDAVLNYEDEELLATIQFVLELDNGIFEVYAMKINDNSIPTALMNVFVYYIFESYDDTNIDYWSILYELGILGNTMLDEPTKNIVDITEDIVINLPVTDSKDTEESDINEYYLLDDFVGKWVDTYSQRCYAEIYKDNGEYVIEIRWANSASEECYWYFRAYPEEGSLCYTEGECWLLTYMDNGDIMKDQIYGAGEGFFILSENKMYWMDYQENAGDNLEFEKMK